MGIAVLEWLGQIVRKFLLATNLKYCLSSLGSGQNNNTNELKWHIEILPITYKILVYKVLINIQ